MLGNQKVQTHCGLSNCTELLGPGAADVGYLDDDGKVKNVRVCSKDAWTLMTAPRGTYTITPDRVLKAIPAKRLIL